ncbi:hypothetical protein CGMCC3_g7623 [Colletotrichum fructicola]|nr:uncharacterized protein CGMCC3_g7623 [Colletotrichum fructicola]KAE9576467.1 hypothetical protein CGMCC3_g7623 [Colletotrichum fructicola]
MFFQNAHTRQFADPAASKSEGDDSDESSEKSDDDDDASRNDL